MKFWNRVIRRVWLVFTLAVSGCIVTPEPLSKSEQISRVEDLQERFAEKWHPVAGKIDLFAVINRALTRNFEIAVARHELNLQRTTLGDVLLGHLPTVRISGRKTERSNPDTSSNSTTASDLKRKLVSAESTWSVLSFGQAYLRSRQQANNLVAKQEDQRRVANSIVVRSVETYLYAEMAQRLLPQVEGFLGTLSNHEERADGLAKDRLVDPVDILVFRTRLVNLKKALRRLREELNLRRIALATLIGSRKVSFGIKSSTGKIPKLELSGLTLEDLENAALLRRPELRISAYRKRNAALDVRLTYASLIPDISLLLGANYDSNSILLNNSHTRYELSATYSLLNLLRFPGRLQISQTKLSEESVRELVVAVSVIEQVRLAYAEWKRLRRTWKMERKGAELWQKIRKIRTERWAFKPLEELRLVETRASAISAQVDLAQAKAEFVIGKLRLIQSIGIDLYPMKSLELGDNVSRRQIRDHWKNITDTLKHDVKLLAVGQYRKDQKMTVKQATVTRRNWNLRRSGGFTARHIEPTQR